ncbi:MAG TPA: GerMN domain-containing protein [Candidatus Colwellbacteria bacterium]|nr:GerMN domain-containing protein [Candidatus Colwellbacteria bacterium]HQA95891.1 GerMN domain-containing protein [Candidatus Colwellbacteria bacterium]
MKKILPIVLKIIIAIAVFSLAVVYVPKLFGQGGLNIFAPRKSESGNVIVREPVANGLKSLPFSVKGEARVFENMIAYELRDAADGFVLSEGNAYANAPDVGRFGPFSVEIKSLRRLPMDGGVILEVFNYSAKDGSRENQVVVPLTLAKQDFQTLQVFFGKQGISEADCMTMAAVPRIVPKTSAPGRESLELLLEGPTRTEAAEGYYTNLNPDVKIQRLAIENGLAEVDFDETLQRSVGGSCRVTAIRSQIIKTLKQFSTVENVVISIDGRTEDILQP